MTISLLTTVERLRDTLKESPSVYPSLNILSIRNWEHLTLFETSSGSITVSVINVATGEIEKEKDITFFLRDKFLKCITEYDIIQVCLNYINNK